MKTQLFYSNQIEQLAGLFIREVSQYNGRSLSPLLVIVPNPYLKKWLQLRIAQTAGIAANFDFQYAEQGFWKLLDIAKKGNGDPAAPLSGSELQVIIYSYLKKERDLKKNYRPFYDYIYKNRDSSNYTREKKMWQLSGELARLFLEYQYYRPHMLNGWAGGAAVSNNGPGSCQARLYRAVFKKGGERDKLDNSRCTLLQYWNRVKEVPSEYDRPVCFFGLSQLSPLFAEIIYETGKDIALDIFALNPCAEFWEDVTTPFEDRWMGVREQAAYTDADGEYLDGPDNDNMLLKLWARPARETIKLLSMLEEAGGAEGRFESRWAAYTPAQPACTVLQTIQEQVLFRSPGTAGETIEQDRSIQVAACPDIFREVETIYNSIIKNLQYNDTLQMTDIAVMVPDMEMYAPVIKSVFNKQDSPVRFSLIDNSAVHESVLVRGITSLFRLYDGSFSRKEVFDIFYNACFMERNGLDEKTVDAWLKWAVELNIFHSFRRNNGRGRFTWEQGLERLRFGRIMEVPGNDHDDNMFRHYRGRVPFSDIETGDAETIDALCSTIELIDRAVVQMREPGHSGKEWHGVLSELVDRLFTVPDRLSAEQAVYQEFRDSLSDLEMFDALSRENGNGPGFTVVRDFILWRIGQIPSSEGSYLSGGINISALVPKRQVPFEIIYIAGMQAGLFPGTETGSRLDLLKHARKIGDVSLTEGNKYLFMETLLSARQKIYLSYIARDLQKDQVLYPNSLLEQLKQYIEQNIIQGPFKVVQVPMSPVSIRYLEDPGDRNWNDLLHWEHAGGIDIVNSNNYERLLLFMRAGQQDPVFVEKNLLPGIKQLSHKYIPDFSITGKQTGPEGSVVETVDINELRKFIRNPVELAVQRHVRIYNTIRESEELVEDEHFYSGFPFNIRFLQQVMQYYIEQQGNTDIDDYFSDYYDYQSIKGNTPENGFSLADRHILYEALLERLGIDSGSGLSHFLEERGSAEYFPEIVIDEEKDDNTGTRYFNAVNCTVQDSRRTIDISLKGRLNNVWTDNVSKTVEVLVLTNSNEFRYQHLLLPWFFYVLARSGLEKGLGDFLDQRAFIVHVSSKNGIHSVTYDLPQEECRQYLQTILEDFFDTTQFDLLPFEIAVDNKMLPFLERPSSPDEKTREEYRHYFLQKLGSELDNAFSRVTMSSVMHLVNLEVPPDAYDKVVSRIYPVIRPVLEAGP